MAVPRLTWRWYRSEAEKIHAKLTTLPSSHVSMISPQKPGAGVIPKEPSRAGSLTGRTWQATRPKSIAPAKRFFFRL
jgi:hypothetical protein